MMNVDYTKLLDACSKTTERIRVDIEWTNRRTHTRFVIRNVSPHARIIKKFQPHHVVVEVIAWIDKRFPQGVFIEGLGGKIFFRFNRKGWDSRTIDRARAHVAKEL